MPNQIYDDYWGFTLANTDFNGENFIGELRAVVSFIDRASDEQNLSERYKQLQTELQNVLSLNELSIRKKINQLLKLGFISSGLKTYHRDAKPYINARNSEQRKLLLSRVVYSSASFKRSVTKDSDKREIAFIIKTLEANGKLTKRELAALMRMDVGKVETGYATKDEIDQMLADPKFIEFEARKYNQISHLWNLVRKLDGIITQDDGSICLIQEAQEIADEESVKESKGRDQYLQGIYKRQLKEEVVSASGRLECMVNRLDYPPQMYIASHIKPLRDSNLSEAYDPNNGLLLSLNIDKLFDSGLISFENDGSMLISKHLSSHSKDLNDYLAGKSLNPKYINEKRKKYLEYHRTHVFS